MGSTVGACLVAAGHRVVWVSEGRSPATRARAERSGLVAVASLSELSSQADVIISVCPPASAIGLAESIHERGYNGLYLDANAVSPETARAVCGRFPNAVDGGIVGPPVDGPGSTRLYVSGEQSSEIENLFSGSDLEVRVVEGEVGAASAVKMCFAAWTKGTAALLFAIAGLADAEGVSDALTSEWETSMPHLLDRLSTSPSAIGPKAWRFSGEMHEIAATFAADDLPDGFHLAAADVYERLASLKASGDSQHDPPDLDDVIALLRRPEA